MIDIDKDWLSSQYARHFSAIDLVVRGVNRTYRIISFFLYRWRRNCPARMVAFHIGGSGLVGLVLLSSSVAGVVLAPVAGHLVDRHDRAQITVIGQTIRASGLALLALIELLQNLYRPPFLSFPAYWELSDSHSYRDN